MLTHVVIFWTDKPLGANRDKLLEGARKHLPNIPGVQNFRAGVPVPSARGQVDDSFAVAISMDFASQEVADSYQSHPEHDAFVNDYFKPNCTRMVVYDFAS